MCPHCRTNAPIVYRGVMAYCTACGAPRVPLASESVTLAGKPAKLGGTIAKILGWLVLIGGISFGLMLAALFAAIFSAPAAAVAFSLPVIIASSVFGYLLLRSGKSISATGLDAQRDTRAKALFALAQHQGGIVRAAEASRSLGVTVNEADAILTDLAKTMSDLVTLEIDEAGGVYYRMRGEPGAPIPVNWPQGAHVRVGGTAASEGPRARVDDVLEGELLDDDVAGERAKSARRRG